MSTHTIERLRFEVEVATAAEGLALQERVSAFRTTGLESILDSCLSGLVPDDRFLRLDTVELELGAVSVERLATELAPRIETALGRAVSATLHAFEGSPGVNREQPVPLDTEHLRQLEMFLERGVLSWSAGSRALGLDGLLDALIEAVPDALRRSLTGRDYHGLQCKRLASQFAPATRRRLLGMFLRHHADTVMACIDALLRIQQHKPLVAATRRQFETALWQAALEFLLSGSRTAFDEIAFIRFVLRRLADHFRVAPEALVAGLVARMHFVTLGFSTRSVLARLLSALAGGSSITAWTQERAAHDAASASDAKRAAAPVAPVDDVGLLVQWLEHGELPVASRGRALDSSRQWMASMLREQPGPLVAALKRIGDRADAVARLVGSFDWAALSSLIQVLEPDYAGFILTYLLAGERFAANRPGVRRVHWCAVLGRLLDPHGQRFEMASFVHASSHRSARRMGMSHAEYLAGLLACAKAVSGAEARFAPLEELLSASLSQLNDSTADALPSKAIPAHSTAGDSPFADAAPLSQPSRAQLRDTLFLSRYFLQYGSLPQHAAVADVADLHRRIGVALLSRSRSMHALLLGAASRPLPRRRMATLFPPALIDSVLRATIPDAAPEASCLLEILGSRRRRGAAELLLASIAESSGRQRDAVAIIKPVLRQLARAESLPYPDLIARLRRSKGRGAKDAAQRTDRLLARLADEAQADCPIEGSASRPSDAESAAAQSGAWEFPEDEPCYIDNAGMVLLWPFLGRYFETLGMLDGGQFRTTAYGHRAVALLQYLVTGDAAGAEYELLLNKILCGLDPCAPLDTGVEMSETESQLSQELLHGVCQNWPPLRNTSTQGLRESFLRREGRLLRESESWSLAVSGESYDLLLGSLPWSLSVIRLPWMKHLLRVEWR